MEHNSPSTMGDNSTDPMDVNTGEVTETEYFSEVANLEDNMDQSIDSLQGSLNLPVFSLAQSTGGLQGSQGFQISAGQKGRMMSQSGGSDDVKLEYVPDIYNQQQQQQSVMHPAFRDDANASSFTTNLPQNSSSGLSTPSAFMAAQGSNFNVVSLGDTGKPFAPQGGVFNSGVSYTFSGDKLSSMVKMGGASGAPGSGSGGLGVGEKTGGGDSDEKTSMAEGGGGGGGETAGPKNKSSPKGKGRKSRATSSSSVDGPPKPDAQAGVAGTKVEPAEPGNGGETGFKPSLLDEILTEKKLALLKSPEVMRFLQSQQENLSREKAFTTRQPMDS